MNNDYKYNFMVKDGYNYDWVKYVTARRCGCKYILTCYNCDEPTAPALNNKVNCHYCSTHNNIINLCRGLHDDISMDANNANLLPRLKQLEQTFSQILTPTYKNDGEVIINWSWFESDKDTLKTVVINSKICRLKDMKERSRRISKIDNETPTPTPTQPETSKLSASEEKDANEARKPAIPIPAQQKPASPSSYHKTPTRIKPVEQLAISIERQKYLENQKKIYENYLQEKQMEKHMEELAKIKNMEEFNRLQEENEKKRKKRMCVIS